MHYGMMLPNLPAPFHFLDLILVVGQPKIKLWRNRQLVETTPSDTANLLVGTGVEFTDQFRGYQVGRDLNLAPDSSVIEFGADLTWTGRYPDFTVAYRNPEFEVDLSVSATDKIAHFVKLRGGLYDHWSLLCRYEGAITYAGNTTEISGLSTLEYARGANVALPFSFFTYHILNVDEATQVLMVEVLGPKGLPMQRAVYVRSLDDHGNTYENNYRFDVHRLESSARITPNGISMHLGTDFTWSVDDDNSDQVIEIHGVSNGDYRYGMGGGYAGSYRYTGRFRGKDIAGVGYVEYIGSHRLA
ncbi:DUF6670 family protein [Gordonia liuliyuniae]|uniref:Uncharacterized protein n=1 Tax=Gordonia liuliyuniae TaxID=2911517 RepID=A0ABS9IWZ5_9ACTN|nr:DUF6670 family protein [Gordonia liuliyuniae]MCF8590036.1 hypothetical protein [Gordonia liuliyuniae]